MMRFDGDSFPSDDLTGMTKDEWIHAVSSDRDVEFGDAIIANLSFRDWCVWFGVLLDSIEDLPVAIFMERAMLTSLSGFVETVHKGRLDMNPWTIECSRECINGNWDLIAPFCDIPTKVTLDVRCSRSRFWVPMLEGGWCGSRSHWESGDARWASIYVVDLAFRNVHFSARLGDIPLSLGDAINKYSFMF
jgi:hypothetical protein